MAEATPGQSPRLLEVKRRSLLEILDSAAKYVVPGSVVLAVAGFCACVAYFHQRGVPLGALSYTQFVAAGILYLGLTAFAFVTGLRLGGRRRAFISYLTYTVVTWGVLSPTSVRTATFVALYFAVVSLSGWLNSSREAQDTSTLALAWLEETFSFRSTTAALNSFRSVILSVALFATLVFPHAPVWLGGGAPRLIRIHWSGPPEKDEQPLLGGGADKRCLFEVHSDDDRLYLLSIEPAPDGKCVPYQFLFLSPFKLDVRGSVHVTVPRSRVSLVVHERTPDF